jgi:hypothetical protein
MPSDHKSHMTACCATMVQSKSGTNTHTHTHTHTLTHSLTDCVITWASPNFNGYPMTCLDLAQYLVCMMSDKLPLLFEFPSYVWTVINPHTFIWPMRIILYNPVCVRRFCWVCKGKTPYVVVEWLAFLLHICTVLSLEASYPARFSLFSSFYPRECPCNAVK